MTTTPDFSSVSENMTKLKRYEDYDISIVGKILCTKRRKKKKEITIM